MLDIRRDMELERQGTLLAGPILDMTTNSFSSYSPPLNPCYLGCFPGRVSEIQICLNMKMLTTSSRYE